MRRQKRHACKRQLRVSPEHSAALRKFASLLEVRPQDFLSRQLDFLIEQLDEPKDRLLSDWATTGLIIYSDAGTAARVNARVTTYLKGRALAIAGKEGSKS